MNPEQGYSPEQINAANEEKKIKEMVEKEQLFDWAIGSDHERIFTVGQVANYASNVMVRGVDKSKIVPVYDWDGKLLWPTEEHIKPV